MSNLIAEVIMLCSTQLLDIEEGFLILMGENGETRADIKIPENDIGKEIQAKHVAEAEILVTVLSACGDEMAIGHKPMTK